MFASVFNKKPEEENAGKAKRLRKELAEADAIVIGAGAGLSASAGFIYTGERFRKYFSDFAEKYHFSDMYSGGFYPYETLEEYWAFWSRYIYVNRYMNAPKPVYEEIFSLVKDKDYFVLTTNVDHCFQKAGFDKHRLFYTQGDYGLFQCSLPCHSSVYENEEIVRRMTEAQGYQIAADGSLTLPEGRVPEMAVPSSLVPHCPKCGRPMTMNLRADQTFVEDKGWHQASLRYSEFLRRHEGMRVLFLELGCGYNTPGIVKFSFWQMTAVNPKATYACINLGEAYAPKEIWKRAICINEDIGAILNQLKLQPA